MSSSDDENEIYINLTDTQYDLISEVANDLGWGVSFDSDDEECDVIWQDGALSPEKLSSLKGFQRINHFPGMYSIARKDHLGKNLNVLKSLFPLEFSFFPPTWILPREQNLLKAQFTGKAARTFIVKPEASCQGRGIFMTRRLESIPEKCVVQRYLHKPYLLDGLKFDIRLYMLVSACDPLRVFLHKDGLLRLATEKYSPPVPSNLDNLFMHLTNYAVNKENPNYLFNFNEKEDFVGHKRSFQAFLEHLREKGEDTDRLWGEICDIATKIMCLVQPLLSHLYRSSQANEPGNLMCFQILGLDIFLDSKLKPYLLEVNHTPSFTCDTPLDHKVKYAVISDTLKLLGLKSGNRKRYYRQFQKKIVERTVRGLSDIKKMRTVIKNKTLRNRTKVESLYIGGYTLIYPRENVTKYDDFIVSAKDIWLTNARGSRKKTENKEEEFDYKPKINDYKGPPPPPKTQKMRETPIVKPLGTDRRKSISTNKYLLINGEVQPPLRKVSSRLPPLRRGFGSFVMPRTFMFNDKQVIPKRG